MVSMLNSGASGPGLSPGQGHYVVFSHTSGSHCQADRRQLTLLFVKPIQPHIIRNVGKI